MNTFQLMPAATIRLPATRALIQGLISRTAGALSLPTSIQVDPTHGWVSWKVLNQIHQAGGRSSLFTKSQALSTANNIVIALDQSFTATGPTARWGIPTYFKGVDIRSAKVYSVRSASGNGLDHHMVCYSYQLPLGNGWGPATVWGAALELMIGRNNTLVGLHIHWRPLAADPINLRINRTPPFWNEYINFILTGRAPDRVTNRMVVIKYYLQDGVATGNSVHPYFVNSRSTVQTDPNSGAYVPATGVQLAATILTRAIVGNTTPLRAIVTGGSGNYRYDWSAWRSDKFEELWHYNLGSLPTASLITASASLFIFRVHLRVQDMNTGELCQTTLNINSSAVTGALVSVARSIQMVAPNAILDKLRLTTPCLVKNPFDQVWKCGKSLDPLFFWNRPQYTIGAVKQAATLNANSGTMITTIHMARMSTVEPIGWLPNNIPGPGFGGWNWGGDPNPRLPAITNAAYRTLQNYTQGVIPNTFGGRTYRNNLGVLVNTNAVVNIVDAEPNLLVPPPPPLTPGGPPGPTVGPVFVAAYINDVVNYINSLPPGEIFVFVGANGRSNMVSDQRPGPLSGQTYIGHWNINECTAPQLTPAHEFGHTVGLQDRYDYYQRLSIDSSNTRPGQLAVILPLVGNPPTIFDNNGWRFINGWNQNVYMLHLNPNTRNGNYTWYETLARWVDEHFDPSYLPGPNMYGFSIVRPDDPLYKLTDLQTRIAFNPTWYENIPEPQRTYFGPANIPRNWMNRELTEIAAFSPTQVPPELTDFVVAGGDGFPLCLKSTLPCDENSLRLPNAFSVASESRWVETTSVLGVGALQQQNIIQGATPAQKYTTSGNIRRLVGTLRSWGGDGNSVLANPRIQCTDNNNLVSYAAIWNFIPPPPFIGGQTFNSSFLLSNPAQVTDRLSRNLIPPNTVSPNTGYTNLFVPGITPTWRLNQQIPFYFNRLFLLLPYRTNQIMAVL